ncbi:MAG: DUF1343 domain-containing protein [Parachlamydia sp.]|nr:DUF1343 domain-containing protein [Parachlamydia sp.]
MSSWIIAFLAGCCLFFQIHGESSVHVGIEQLWNEENIKLLRGKRVGIITNHTALTSQREWTVDLLKANAGQYRYKVVALFAPEHGLRGSQHAGEHVKDEKDADGIPIYSLHGSTRRPTSEMLKEVDLLVYDIQDLGSRSYTYVTTLFYAMEEAAARKIPVVVLDRPNPINGIIVDGPMLEEKWRSFVGYLNVPYCHGMTVGELARLFNGEYKVGCQLHVVPMKGWNRRMSFDDTGLLWVPTSPHIPEASTAFYYPTTGLLGELEIVNIGVGYTLPFKLIGAPWLDGERFAKALNDQKFAGVAFLSFHYRPFYGKFAHQDCGGVLIRVTDKERFRPVSTQYLIIGMLKGLYPKEFKEALEGSKQRRDFFSKVNGTEEVFRIMQEIPHIVWPLRTLHQDEREVFKNIRQRYLIAEYGN